MPSQEKPPKSEEKDDQKKEETSFFKGLRGYLSLKLHEEEEEDQKSSSDDPEKVGDNAPGEVKAHVPDPPVKAEKEGNLPQSTEEDPTQHVIENFKAHEAVQSLIEKKTTILKAVAVVISIILIVIAIIYSIGPTEQVASNVIFGERAMFSAFLVLVAFLILTGVFAGRLLEGKYLKNIHHELEIVEGKKQKDDHKNSSHDPVMERINKKDK